MVLFMSVNKQFLPSVMIKFRLSVYYFWLQTHQITVSFDFAQSTYKAHREARYPNLTSIELFLYQDKRTKKIRCDFYRTILKKTYINKKSPENRGFFIVRKNSNFEELSAPIRYLILSNHFFNHLRSLVSIYHLDVIHAWCQIQVVDAE